MGVINAILKRPRYKRGRAGGKLFLSGFFITDMDELKAVAEIQNLKFNSYKNENEWAMLLFEKTI